MLNPRKKITKKQLKEDKLLTTVNKVVAYLETEWQKLLMAATAIILIFFVVSFVRNSSIEREHRAASALYPVEDRYIGQVFDDQLVAGLNTIIDQYKDTDSGSRARFLLANTHFTMENYELAEAAFRTFLSEGGGTDFMHCSAYAGIAASYEQRAMYTEAVEYYLKSANDYPGTFTVPDCLLGAARAYIKLGNMQEAKEQCTKILERYPDTPQAQQAEVIIAKM